MDVKVTVAGMVQTLLHHTVGMLSNGELWRRVSLCAGAAPGGSVHFVFNGEVVMLYGFP